MYTYAIKKYYTEQNIYRRIVIVADEKLTKEQENKIAFLILNTLDGVTVTII